MKDYADKGWLRNRKASVKILDLLARMILVGLVLLILAWILSVNEARAAAPMHAVLFETSGQPITFDEAQRAHPDLGRPSFCASLQNGTDAPWHHRICYFSTGRLPAAPSGRLHGGKYDGQTKTDAR